MPRANLRNLKPMDSALFTSDTAEWGTPQPVFDYMSRLVGGFDLDVCASAENAKCPLFFSLADEFSALEVSWRRKRHGSARTNAWMNPPYGDTISRFVDKAIDASATENVRVGYLVPARTDTAWFNALRRQSSILIFVMGRLVFTGGNGSKFSAPFPSALGVTRREREGKLDVHWIKAEDLK